MNKQDKQTTQKNGITLISLVITIILLLILATVAISLAVDSDGLFSKAGDAANKWNSSVAAEGSALENLMLMANNIGGTTPPPSTLPEGWSSEVVVDTVEEGDRIAPIPAGFTVSGITTGDDAENTIANGLVIYKTGNEEITEEFWTNTNAAGELVCQTDYDQYVWIPVDDINDMVMCSVCGGGVENLVYDDATKTLACTSTHAEETTPRLVGKLYTVADEDIGQTPITDASGNQTGVIFDYDMNFEQDTQEYPEDYTGYREPAVVNGDNDYEVTILQMQSEFDSMAKSVAKYGGFYVSRYEVGTNGSSKKGQTVMTDATSTMWYGFYNQLKGDAVAPASAEATPISTNSQMLWGSQYDQVIKFIGSEAEVGHNDRNLSDEPALSGNNPDDKMKNIYDLEGNYGELTAEANDTDLRVIRGGDFSGVGNGYFAPASLRGNYGPTGTYGSISARSTLYVNL